MKILIACEQSGVVRSAFRALGHDAWSCDILPSGDGSPFHHQCDVLELLTGNGGYVLPELNGCGSLILPGPWDMMIAHPPCDFLTNSAAWAYSEADFVRYPGVGYHQKVKLGTLTGEARWRAREDAAKFFLALWHAPIARVCLENPIGFMNTLPGMRGVRPQIIQPYQFGDDASKATCLWLKGLPPLIHTKYVEPRIVEKNGQRVQRWANQTDSGQNRLSPSDDRASLRAVTYTGIANAMAQQWGAL